MRATIVLYAILAASCADPVRDDRIAALGPEADGVPEGALHRPGQPCLVCHSAGGPASDHKFALAGTLFTAADATKGVADVQVLFTDVNNDKRSATSNEAGNFFVTEEDWPDLTYPLITGIKRGSADIPMKPTINREGSCNFCHGLPSVDQRTSVGPIIAPGGE